MADPAAAPTLGFLSGLRAVLVGLRRVVKDGALRRLTVAPVLVTLLAYGLALGTAVLKIDDVVAWVWAPPEGPWLHALWVLVVALAFLAFAVILVLLFVGVANVIAGPFYERLALRVLDELGVARRDIGFLHGLAIDGGWTIGFGVPAAMLGLLALIPVVGPFFGGLAAMVAALGLAGAAAGPAVSATGGGLRARLRLFGARPGFMAGAALMLALTVLVPVLGLVIVPGAVVGLTEALARARALPPA